MATYGGHCHSTIVWVNVYKYVMNGRCTGHLYLNRNSTVLWHNKETDRTTGWHGDWYTTHDRRALKVHFDYGGRCNQQMRFPKWTWLKDYDGIDYEGRWIQIQFLTNFASHDGGQTYVPMPAPIEDMRIHEDEWEIINPPS